MTIANGFLAKSAQAAGVSLSGPLLITPRVFGDERGFFLESWNQRTFAAALEGYALSPLGPGGRALLLGLAVTAFHPSIAVGAAGAGVALAFAVWQGRRERARTFPGPGVYS